MKTSNRIKAENYMELYELSKTGETEIDISGEGVIDTLGNYPQSIKNRVRKNRYIGKLNKINDTLYVGSENGCTQVTPSKLVEPYMENLGVVIIDDEPHSIICHCIKFIEINKKNFDKCDVYIHKEPVIQI